MALGLRLPPQPGVLGLGQRKQEPSAPATPTIGEGLLPELPELPQRNAGSILRDISADIRGVPAPSDVAKKERMQAMQARLGQFGQLLSIGEILRQGLSRVPVAQQAEKRKALREQLEGLQPGFGGFFDAFVGEQPELSQDLIQLAAKDDGARMLMLYGTPQEFSEYARTTLAEKAREQKDLRLKPVVAQKVSRLLTTTDPELRKQLGKVLTVDDIEALNDSLPEGEEGYKLTPEELESLPRIQDFLARRYEGRFQTSEDFEAEQKLKRDQRLAESQNATRTAQREEERQIKTEEKRRESTVEIENRSRNILNNLARFEQSIKDYGSQVITGSEPKIREALLDEIAQDMAKLVDPNSVARPSEVELARASLPQASETFTFDSSVLEQIQALRERVQDRVRTAYEVRGIETPGSQAGGSAGEGQIIERKLKDGSTVRVRQLPDGSFEEVG